MQLSDLNSIDLNLFTELLGKVQREKLNEVRAYRRQRSEMQALVTSALEQLNTYVDTRVSAYIADREAENARLRKLLKARNAALAKLRGTRKGK